MVMKTKEKENERQKIFGKKVFDTTDYYYYYVLLELDY